MHIMLDLETWGKRPGYDIRSIGAVVFDPVNGTVGGIPHTRVNVPQVGYTPSFYTATENPLLPKDERPVNQQFNEKLRRYKLTRDPETVQWWNDQTAEAQAAFANPVDLSDALIAFIDWFFAVNGNDIEQINACKVWANGPQFDVSILEAVYHAVQLPAPWYYRAPRDFRTITDAAGMTHDDFCNYGTAHNALDDAIAQAMTVCEAYKRLGLVK